MDAAIGQQPREPTIRLILKHDLLASVVVFLIALPLCMGIAIASNVPPALGLITGIVGGILVGTLAGAPLQVSGPAAGLSVMIFEIVQRDGVEVMGLAVLVAGIIQAIAGILRFGQWFRAVSPAVIRGMLSGIGILILASQFHVMVDDKPRASGWQNLLSIPEAIQKGVAPTPDAAHHWAAMIGLLTISIIIGWRFLSRTPLKFVPAPLVASVAATAFAAIASLPVNFVSVPDSLFDAVKLPSWSGLQAIFDRGVTPEAILLEGIAIAFVASAETLLCAVAVDQMHTGPRTRYDRELFAQGVGNTVCGALGALPMTGVIVRSKTNLDAGGKTRASAILHGFWLVLFVAALPFTLRMIPTSALAAMLVYTGWKLIDFKALRDLRKYGWGEVAIFVITILLIVAVDLLTGVIVGVALSAAKLLYTFSHLEIRKIEEAGGARTTLYLRGVATFIRLPQLAAALDEVKPNAELHVHLEELRYIDHACLDLLMNWEKQHASTGGHLVIDWDGLTARYRETGKRRGASAPTTEPDLVGSGAADE